MIRFVDGLEVEPHKVIPSFPDIIMIIGFDGARVTDTIAIVFARDFA